VAANEIPEDTSLSISFSKTLLSDEYTDMLEIVAGEEVELYVRVKNVTEISLAYDERYFNYFLNYTIYHVASQTILHPCFKIQMTVLPHSQNDVVALQPGEVQFHKVYLRNIITWGVPHCGQWNTDYNGGNIGQLGEYLLSYRYNIPVGMRKHLHESGFQGNLYEGTIQGQTKLLIVPPPLSSKEEILSQVKKILANSPDPLMDENLTRLFLQSYYIAPKELQAILLRIRQFTLSENNLEVCYLGLDMFDTPEAKAAVDSFVTKSTNRQQDNNGVNVIYRIILFRRIALAILIIIVVLIVVFLVRHKRRKR
jgi:hypothetical protein